MKYRGIEYSVVDMGNVRWRWRIHPTKESDVFRTFTAGEVFGVQRDALAAAEAAIDRMLAGGSS